MSTSDTPLTDGFKSEHKYKSPSKKERERHARALETRLHAAEELLKLAVNQMEGVSCAYGVAWDHEIGLIRAHLANAVDPASATTTKETTK